MRQRLAQEAARVLLESGSRDFAMAKRKAAEHLRAHDTRNLPTNLEIEQALAEYQRLFRSENQPQTLQKLREVACEAMRFFSDFKPRLVGPVLSGTADINTTITLHVFSDTYEEISLLLLNNNIPFENQDKRLRFGRDLYEIYPSIVFYAEQQKIEVVVFPENKQGLKPLSPIDGKPMQRADIASVEVLLHESSQTV
ncbi:MAG: hypothetical protein PVG75_07055 [Thioalkalispiraceae bacterium]